MFEIVGFDLTGWLQQDKYTVEFSGIVLEIFREKTLNGNQISNQICMESTGKHGEIYHSKALQFLSELSWLYKVAILETTHGGGSVRAKYATSFAGHKLGRVVIDLSLYEPLTTNDEQKLALGFYKEGTSNNSIFHKFFSLFKILNITLPDGHAIKKWLTEYFETTTSNRTKNTQEPYEQAENLWKSCRCALAHANSAPVINVDNYEDHITINKNYSIIKNACEHYMKTTLSIPHYYCESGTILIPT